MCTFSCSWSFILGFPRPEIAGYPIQEARDVSGFLGFFTEEGWISPTSLVSPWIPSIASFFPKSSFMSPIESSPETNQSLSQKCGPLHGYCHAAMPTYHMPGVSRSFFYLQTTGCWCWIPLKGQWATCKWGWVNSLWCACGPVVNRKQERAGQINSLLLSLHRLLQGTFCLCTCLENAPYVKCMHLPSAMLCGSPWCVSKGPCTE